MAIIKFFLRCLFRLLYRVEVQGMEHYHHAGKRVLIIANHTSLLDGILLYAWLPETPTFAINTDIADRKEFKFYLKFVDLFRMDQNNPLAIKSMIHFIQQDNKAVIFPEGRITYTGSLMKIYEGPSLIADKADATILPIQINGAQYSKYSYLKDKSQQKYFPKIRLTVLPPEKLHLPNDIHGHERRKLATIKLNDLMFKMVYASFNKETTLFNTLITSANTIGKSRVIMEDINREPITYKQLIIKSIVLSDLIANDTEQDEYVGLLLPNVTATPVTFFAMQSIGRIPAMLNYTAGISNILKACETAQLKTIYTSKKFVDNAGLHELIETLSQVYNVIFLEDFACKIRLSTKLKGLFRSFNPIAYHRKQIKEIDANKPAAVIFTSGSEGVPKGVVLSHKNILSNTAQVVCHIDFNPADTMLTCLPLFHSFGLTGGFLIPTFLGAKIFFYPTPLHYRIIPELVYELGATILFGTNTFFKGYAKHANPLDFDTLRYIVAGAEPLREDTMQLYVDKFAKRILQGYGVSETSPVISVNTPKFNQPGTCGRIISDIDYYLEPVEGIDKGGRLIVKGPNVMLGYLLHNKPGEIIPPTTSRGQGWYDTGDIAHIDEEGYVYILGRAKRFAKIGGEMVSLTQVEELAMQTWPGYLHAAVSLPDDRKGEKIILITDYKDATKKDIQEFARKQKMGELIIPKRVVLTDEMPVLGTGKTDYVTLNKLAEEEDQTGSGWIKRLSEMMHKH